MPVSYIYARTKVVFVRASIPLMGCLHRCGQKSVKVCQDLFEERTPGRPQLQAVALFHYSIILEKRNMATTKQNEFDMTVVEMWKLKY